MKNLSDTQPNAFSTFPLSFLISSVLQLVGTFAHLSDKLAVRAGNVMTCFVSFFCFPNIYSAILFANLSTFSVLEEGFMCSATRLENENILTLKGLLPF